LPQVDEDDDEVEFEEEELEELDEELLEDDEEEDDEELDEVVVVVVLVVVVVVVPEQSPPVPASRITAVLPAPLSKLIFNGAVSHAWFAWTVASTVPLHGPPGVQVPLQNTSSPAHPNTWTSLGSSAPLLTGVTVIV
jgi:hypothetical protein